MGREITINIILNTKQRKSSLNLFLRLKACQRKSIIIDQCCHQYSWIGPTQTCDWFHFESIIISFVDLCWLKLWSFNTLSWIFEFFLLISVDTWLFLIKLSRCLKVVKLLLIMLSANIVAHNLVCFKPLSCNHSKT